MRPRTVQQIYEDAKGMYRVEISKYYPYIAVYTWMTSDKPIIFNGRKGLRKFAENLLRVCDALDNEAGT